MKCFVYVTLSSQPPYGLCTIKPITQTKKLRSRVHRSGETYPGSHTDRNRAMTWAQLVWLRTVLVASPGRVYRMLPPSLPPTDKQRFCKISGRVTWNWEHSTHLSFSAAWRTAVIIWFQWSWQLSGVVWEQPDWIIVSPMVGSLRCMGLGAVQQRYSTSYWELSLPLENLLVSHSQGNVY